MNITVEFNLFFIHLISTIDARAIFENQDSHLI
jgi:hypothetical protein